MVVCRVGWLAVSYSRRARDREWLLAARPRTLKVLWNGLGVRDLATLEEPRRGGGILAREVKSRDTAIVTCSSSNNNKILPGTFIAPYSQRALWRGTLFL